MPPPFSPAQHAPALLSSALVDTVLDVVECLVECIGHLLLSSRFCLLEWRDGVRKVLQESELVNDRASWRHRLKEVRYDGKKLLAVLRVTPRNAGNSPGAVGDHVLRPAVRRLDKTAEGLLVLCDRPAVEVLRVGVPHDGVDEVLVPLEVLAVAREGQNLHVLLYTNGGWQCVTIAVVLLSPYEQVTSNLVRLDPGVGGTHDLPLIDGAILLVESAKMESRLNTCLWDVPETTRPRETR